MANEADTCRKFVVPRLQAAGWENEPHSIAGQRFFTDGPMVVRGNRAERKPGVEIETTEANEDNEGGTGKVGETDGENSTLTAGTWTSLPSMQNQLQTLLHST